MRLLPILLAAALLATPALAAEPAAPAPTLLLNPTPLPVTQDGRLVNYIFVTLRLMCRPGADIGKIRPKEPFFRDAMVRAAARTSFAQADGVHLDEAKLKAQVLKDAAAIAGKGEIVDMKVVKQEPQKPFVRQAH